MPHHSLTKPAPIAVFGYRRPQLLRRTLRSLAKNDLARQSDVTIFIDGPKNNNEVEKVERTREEARRITGFRSKSLVFQEKNIGLRASLVSGTDKIIQQAGKAIIIEDDLVLSPFFLNFINHSLERYRDNPKIFSICGFNFNPHYFKIPKRYPYDVWANYRFHVWGWATWADRWNRVDWDVSDYEDFINDPDAVERYLISGTDVLHMLKDEVKSPGEMWDVLFHYAQFRANGLCVQPRRTLVENHGDGPDAAHTKNLPALYHSRIRAGWQPKIFPDALEIDDEITARHHALMQQRIIKNPSRYVILRSLLEFLRKIRADRTKKT